MSSLANGCYKLPFLTRLLRLSYPLFPLLHHRKVQIVHRLTVGGSFREHCTASLPFRMHGTITGSKNLLMGLVSDQRCGLDLSMTVPLHPRSIFGRTIRSARRL